MQIRHNLTIGKTDFVYQELDKVLLELIIETDIVQKHQTEHENQKNSLEVEERFNSIHRVFCVLFASVMLREFIFF